MTLVRGQVQPTQRTQASEAPINRSNDGDHEDPLASNKPGPSKAPAEAPAGPPQTLSPAAPNIVRYTQKDIDHSLQTFLQASKGGSGDILKAKILDVYRGKSHMECYNFCQQYEDHFATYIAIEPNRIPFAAFFLQD